MRIGIDARFFGPIGKGLGRYTERLIEHLEEIDDQNEYVIFLRQENFQAFKPRRKNFQKVLADFSWYSFAEQVQMPIAISKTHCDLLHFPHFNVPLFVPIPFVVTIHDLILIQFPTKKATALGPFYYWIKKRGYSLVLRHAVNRARVIITVSAFSKNQILNTFPSTRGKILVTHEAVNRPGVKSAKPDAPLPRAVLEKYKLNEKYLLYVGNAYPHKNLERLIEVWAGLSSQMAPCPHLALVGKKDFFYERLSHLVSKRGLHSLIHFIGQVTDEELEPLYQNAAAFIFPSLLEGFGLPPLEAMANDIPVLSSHVSSMPEILGNAPMYFDPHDVSDIIHTIKTALKDEEKRILAIQRGREQIKKYSWTDLAKKTLLAYEDAIQRPHSIHYS